MIRATKTLHEGEADVRVDDDRVFSGMGIRAGRLATTSAHMRSADRRKKAAKLLDGLLKEHG